MLFRMGLLKPNNINLMAKNAFEIVYRKVFKLEVELK